ncbi:peptidase domain-containing ABC transporter [Photobacterium damselae subsp. damselae]|uniref:Peptidase domain-containing ABC transporter n=2 Tax=Photobacterium damselae TaxID=38293 RepID=A0AAD3WUY7_PHODD|nr:peptidase domain-containing ABC transporter [Photobacterium damselae subsp. damselae]
MISPRNLLSFSTLRPVPIIIQSEMAECGLACLAMIASYYGLKIDVAKLRKHCNLGLQGMNLKNIMDISSELELATRAVKCELEDLKHLSLPCILHWDLDHFVVLTKVTKKWITINDPAVGKRKLSITEVSNSFTGVVLELTPSSSFKKKETKTIMKISQLWERIDGLKRALASLLCLSIVMQFIALVSPYYIQWVIDSVLLSNDKPLLLVLAIGFSLLLVIQVGVNALRSWLVLKLNSIISIQIGANLFHHLLRLPMKYFECRHIGDIISRFGSTSSIRTMLTTGIVESCMDGAMAVAILIMMFLYNVKLTLLVICVVILSYLSQLMFYYPNRRLTSERILASAKEESNFLETLRAIQTIKLFSNETERQNMWLNRFADVINAEIRLGRVQIAEATINKILLGLEGILVVYFGSLAVMSSNLTVGMLIAFIAYKTQFTSCATSFIDKMFSFKLLGLHLERLSDIVFEQRETVNSSMVLPKQLSGHIRFENISFRYADNLDWVLRNVSFEIMPGESVALVGISGSGKTTLMKLLLGIFKPTEGDIFVDGYKINDSNLHNYRQHLGTVMQDDVLFSGTICENITMFESNYDHERMVVSCKQANILDEILSLPMGFNSLVGDMGNSFSGGQLQRLYLARALYKQPQILCLDEATSHLDTENEQAINASISQMSMTRVIIAHRKETIAAADRIIKV